MINKLHTEKVLEHVSHFESIGEETINNFRNCILDSREILHKMLWSSVPIPFIMTKDGNLLFVFQHIEAI